MAETNDFVLKEYEKIYDLYEIHYDTCQKISNTYLLIVGAFLSILSFVYKDSLNSFNFYELNDIALFSLIIIIIVGFCMFMMLLEHKMKIVLYVRCINAIRKCFCDMDPNLNPYLLLPKDVTIPKYFAFGKDFFWEICSLGVLNSIIASLGIINVLNRWQITYFNCPVFLILFSGILMFFCILFYALRGKTSIIPGYNLPETTDNQK